ncbi:GNAT family N-acetyltransferase [Guptibacillus algicola]|uniref:GNAT family N-acetyltransferase n=1 Tax=Guptibacillus algicola TaxID=225844 RepID=UPI001CD77546|nr:GNAT family N-acetyltransferase [Alkalihalobacillus algicola]MCA0987639.1 GNAT family N-acetyltransferase [Alkalihalobacillus algicola]
MTKSTTEQVKLVRTQGFHLEALRGFTLSDTQLKYTSLPMPAFELSMKDPERHPVVVLSEEKVVGFFVLHSGKGAEEYTSNKNAMLLRAFSIDQKEQGNGYGKEAMSLVKEYVKTNFPDIDEVVLGVNEENVAARKIYLEHGYVDLDKKKEGRSGTMSILHLFV